MKVIKKIFKTLLILILIGCIVGAGTIFYFYQKTPKIDPTSIYDKVQKTSYLYDDKGELIDELYFDQDRELVEFSEIPSTVTNAFIAIEDKTFYQHHGINYKRIIGAIYYKLTGKSSSISGTSTITQQLARNVFLPDTMFDRTIDRKISEILYAYQIENKLKKDEILEAYLNTIYFGFGCYGINAAAHTYFSKDVKDLTLAEAAWLAALPQSPHEYALVKTEPSDTTTKIQKGFYADSIAQNRRDLVLDLMQKQGLITASEAEEAKVPIEDLIKLNLSKRESTYTYFKDYLVSVLTKDIADEFAMSDEEALNYIYTGGLKIYSTVNTEMQKVTIEELEDDYNIPGNYGEEETQAAMVITEVGTGQVKAMVGGRFGEGERLFNRATSPRQPGSSIKPLSVYSAALQKSYDYAQRGQKYPLTNYHIDSQGTSKWGDYITASSTVVDERCTVDGNYWPENFSRTFSGRKTFRRALQQSLNTCAVKILYQVGFDYSRYLLESYGISTLVTEGEYNDVNPAALALGAMTDGVTPLDMSIAYATFPNNGIKNSPVCYTKVLDAEDTVILEGKSEETKVLDEGVAWIMTDLLKSVVTDGIAGNASISGVQVGGKTGTTNDSYDIWFCGFAPKYSAALWIGTDKNHTLTTGSAQAALVWSRVMERVPGITNGEYKDMPKDVTKKYGEYYTTGTEPYSRPDTSDGSKKNSDEDFVRTPEAEAFFEQ